MEGYRDRSVMHDALRSAGVSASVGFILVDSIDVPVEELEARGLSTNCTRDRLIVIGDRLVAQIAPDARHKVRCVIDRDFDPLLHADWSSDVVCYTDYRDVEMYAFNEAVIARYLTHALGVSNPQIPQILADLACLSQRVYSFRWASLNSKTHVSVPKENKSLRRCLTKKPIGLDENRLMQSTLGGVDPAICSRFKAALQQVQPFQGERRFFMRGHDLGIIAHWYFDRVLQAENALPKDPEALIGGLLAAVQMEELRSEPLFATLSAVFVD